jgi:antitoxin component YwqK of YwqJK toxin-antitoxin module
MKEIFILFLLLSSISFGNSNFTGEISISYVTGKVEYHEKYVEGKKHGTYKSYYISGKPKELGRYNKGKKNKKWVSYYKNGNLKQESNFKNGILNGNLITYYENGRISSKLFIENNRVKEKVRYDLKGRIIN